MHDQRIMHRDLKPANIFLTLKGRVSACGPFSHEEEAEVLLFASMERARDRRPTTEGTDAQKWTSLSTHAEKACMCMVPNNGSNSSSSSNDNNRRKKANKLNKTQRTFYFPPFHTIIMDEELSDIPVPFGI